jgi:membrane-bound metal-dependent hydrolase YbcI (DUF457 family)
MNNERGLIDFNGRIHWVFGLAVYLYLVLGNWELDHILNPFLVVIGSLFPDADHRKAPAGKMLPLWLFFRHRGFTHSLEGMICFLLPLLAYNRLYALSFGIGYITHLLLDSLTPSGVRWIYFKKKKKPRPIG